jgi:C1A family cysteine protease
MTYELDLEALRSSIEEEDAGWKAGETPLTRMSEEDRQLHLGYVPGPKDPSLEEQEREAEENLEAFMVAEDGAYGYPTSVDLRNGGYITPVRDQRSCGSCVAFGVAAAAEGRLRKQREMPNLSVDYSEAHLFYCHAREQGRRCGGSNGGWWTHKALDVFRDKGVVDEACYPYTAGDQACSNLCSDANSRLAKISGWSRLTSTADMKEWLSTKGPLVACYTVYQDFYSYRTGIYRHVSGSSEGGHCVCVVGYNDSQQYWICKNSWGTNWGDEGYFKIAYGQCGIDSFIDAIDAIAETGWVRNVRVIGLWSSAHDRNAWAYIENQGWRKVSPASDNVFFNMLTQLTEAKAGKRHVDYYQENGIIKQVYVF